MQQFKELVGKVNKIKNDKSPHFYKIKEKYPEKLKLSDSFENAPVSMTHLDILPEDFLEYKIAGIQHKTFKKLTAGQFPINSIIDLHGFNLIEAEIYINTTIESILEPQMTCIKIIHGKGYSGSQFYNPTATLKNFCAKYLQYHPRVLAFCSCPIQYGGTGALYVLIKRVRHG